MISPQTEVTLHDREINSNSLVWLAVTTLLALTVSLVGAWGMSTSKRVDTLESQVSLVITQQAVLEERYKALQDTLDKLDSKVDQVLSEQRRLRK